LLDGSGVPDYAAQRLARKEETAMGKIVFAGAMSHVLDPEYYQAACGDVGREKVTVAMDAIAKMGDRFVDKKADALIVVADDHMNAFSFTCVPAICVRIGRTVQRMVQDNAEAFDKVLDHMPAEYPLHEALGNSILEQGLQNGFDLALSWEAPVDHAFLSPVNTMLGTRPVPPLVPIFVNAFIAPQPTARRCFQFGQHIARVVAKSPWNVGILATGGLSHFPELLLGRVGETDTVFDRKLIHWMETGEHEPLLDLTADELHKTGSHEFLNWMVLLGAITPAPAVVRYFGELPRINLAAVEWSLG
jgi:2,3-dihydroxyphenylpropionate 1,2-dioxygenase